MDMIKFLKFRLQYCCCSNDFSSINHNKIQHFISRDVVFHEEIFPFHSIGSPETFVDPFPNLVLPSVSVNNHPAVSVDGSVLGSPEAAQMPIVPKVPGSSLRRSTRLIRPPSYLHDFHCNSLLTGSSATILYPLSKVLDYSKLSSSHRKFVMNVSSVVEPQFYH